MKPMRRMSTMRSIQAYYFKFKLAGGLTMPYVEAAIRSLLMSGLALYNGSANYIMEVQIIKITLVQVRVDELQQQTDAVS